MDAGAVLSLHDGPQGCDPGYCAVWFRFRMLRRYLAYRSSEVGRIYRMLDLALWEYLWRWAPFFGMSLSSSG